MAHAPMSFAAGVSKQEVEDALKHIDVTIEELAGILRRGHEFEVKDINHWEGLAEHVAGIVAVALKKERESR